MARLSISVLTTKSEESSFVEHAKLASQKNKLGLSIICKPYKDILEEVSNWAVLPEVVMFDLPPDEDVFKAIDELSKRFPEGDVDLILTGVSNDVKTYRALKGMGVFEVFPDDPSQEDLDLAVSDIAQRELRSAGIDPRRAVYVWGTAGGCGATTIALGFARHLARSGQRTLLIDMDIFSTPASYLVSAKEGAQETYGLIEGLMNPQRIDSVFLERAIHKVDKNLFYLSARKKPNDKNFDPLSLSILVERAQRNFDVVVVDTPWRPQPAVDWGKVNGTSFIVSSPMATSYLGFTTIAKELESTASKAPVYGIVNKSGEFKSSDFTEKMFSGALDGDVYSIPYDAQTVGKLFFAQKTILDAGGKISAPFKRIVGLLPEKSEIKSPSRSKFAPFLGKLLERFK